MRAHVNLCPPKLASEYNVKPNIVTILLALLNELHMKKFTHIYVMSIVLLQTCFIPKDQSNIMSLMAPDNLTRTDDNLCPRNSVSEDSKYAWAILENCRSHTSPIIVHHIIAQKIVRFL